MTTTEVLFNIPSRETVSENNKAIFDTLKGKLGFVPNLFATYAHSETALGDYLALNNRKTSLSNKEKEIVNLVTSQINECDYCLAAHTAISKMAGFSDNEIIEIRKASISFNQKYANLATFVKETVLKRGKISQKASIKLLEAGFSKENIIDIIVLIGDKTISNYINNVTKIPVDFPDAQNI